MTWQVWKKTAPMMRYTLDAPDEAQALLRASWILKCGTAFIKAKQVDTREREWIDVTEDPS